MDRPYAGPIGVNLNSTSGPAYGGFLPTQLSGCVLWLRADLGITKDGSDKVSAWADQSGSGNHFAQGTGADQPLYVAGAYAGQPALRGDNTDKLTSAAAVGSGANNTLFAVFTGAGAATSYVMAGVDGSTCAVLHRFSAALVEWFNGGGADRYTFASGLFAGAPHVLTVAQSNGVSLQGWWDGASSFGPVVPTTAFAGLRYVMGYAGGANASSGDMLEVVEYSRVLSAAERLQVERYLGARYGITVA